jgi:hypothetical protein
VDHHRTINQQTPANVMNGYELKIRKCSESDVKRVASDKIGGGVEGRLLDRVELSYLLEGLADYYHIFERGDVGRLE